MSDDEELFETKVVITRGTGTNDRDKITTKVTAPTLEILTQRVAELRAEMEDWADDFREIEPERGRRLADDQSQLGGEA
ncbi:hypothetical protein [Halorubrum sp. CBA1229]|uniref:DUF7389 domain-containing protein n=1 Tax=Halorubrum sp. CBA1229 TaxID=1853699 RepID=UPI000F410E50|nr:hypothetical protein [Halorubrum sp. CBA1229]QKY16387.1 hypothetical protein Hrr1229_005660 [Halorubrum sp. CBA1229]